MSSQSHRLRRLTLATALVAAGLTFPTLVTATGQTEPPTARQAADAMGKGFNLGQMFDAEQHPATLAEARPKIDAYYARGFRVLRIPVTWTEPIDGVVLASPETGAIIPDTSRLAELTAVVDYALAKPGLYVVLNAHHEARLKDGARGDVLERLWSDISDRFKDRDHRLMFEILNEPHLTNHDPIDPATLREMTGRAYAQIRADTPQRIVIIGGNQWFAAEEMARTWPHLEDVGSGRDPYLMATFHHYHPWTFNGDNQGDYADAWTEADMEGPMTVMARWASTVGGGMPVFIGEWGVGWKSRYETMDCNNIRLWYSLFHARYAAQAHMPTAVWDDGGWFQLYDHEKARFSSNLIDCVDGECRWQGEQRFNSDCN